MAYMCRKYGNKECDGCQDCYPVDEEEQIPFDDLEEPDYSEMEED